MPKLDGKIAVITGGNSGIGLATAKVFVKEGARIYITGRRQPELEAAAALLGPRATPVHGDVSKPADLDRLYDQIRAETGRVDVVFANAGAGALASLGDITEEDVDYQLNVNVKGAIWTVQRALPLMGPGGSIILNASVVATKGFANWSVYSATKAAVRNFARTWSSDLRGKNIRVNAISPGVIPTPGHEKTGLGPEAVASFMEYAASISPLGRTGTDEEVAKVVAFLASDDSSFVTASEIFVDGGIAQVQLTRDAVRRHYLSNGCREGRYLPIGDVRNTPGRSMSVRLTGLEPGEGPAGDSALRQFLTIALDRILADPGRLTGQQFAPPRKVDACAIDSARPKHFFFHGHRPGEAYTPVD